MEWELPINFSARARAALGRWAWSSAKLTALANKKMISA
jgi:hypothetical protein